jgi:hypothetical protein
MHIGEVKLQFGIDHGQGDLADHLARSVAVHFVDLTTRHIRPPPSICRDGVFPMLGLALA